jgi:anthranilate synthase/aminodeoxychorismate synthase-like glutamine amidotransferase
MLLIIDNYDSFTYNLVQYLRELGFAVMVYHHDKISIAEVIAAKPSHIIISPGPGRPEDAGITLPLIRALCGRIPILGVCLGHQALAAAFGGKIVSASEIMHGKTSLIYHHQQGIFSGIPQPFTAMRYHSLVVDPITLPTEFIVTARTLNSSGTPADIMGIQHRHLPLVGVQFHPESIATQAGHLLLANFLHHFTMSSDRVSVQT